MKKGGILSFAFIAILISSVYGQDNFYAYHTKRVHTSTDYLGKYADLIIVIGEGRQLEFTRKTQYLPRWVTPEGSFMVDDFFPGRDSDHLFNYNYVRLLEQSPEKIVVHWRYIPDISMVDQANADLNPTFMEGFTAAVHETFTIYPSGKVEREVKDARGSLYDNWNKPGYGDRQILQLNDNGVVHGSVTWGDKSQVLSPLAKGNPVISPKRLENPVLSWSFDEGGGDYPEELREDIEEIMEYEPEELVGVTIEHMTMEITKILGHGSLYRKGVSGTALGFDGYYTGVQMKTFLENPNATYFEELEFPQIKDALAIEAWIALDAYPYNLAPIVHHSKRFGQEGYYFGIDPYGKVVFTVNGQTVISTDPLELYRWTHVSGVVGNGSVTIYVDGVKTATGTFNGEIALPKTDFMIGLNSERERCSDFVRSNMQNIPFIYGIQGLLDEVRIYDKALSDSQISSHYETFVPSDRTSSLEKAILPGEVGQAQQFGAYYKNLEHHELWDRMWRLPDQTDVVVKFDNNPASVVYWHGTNFAANWVTDNNRWMADQSSEIFTQYGCSEHMADKQTRHSYARIIENNDARVVVHWRYPCVDVGYVCTDKRNWTDEYHTIYPDGTAVRKVVFNNVNQPGFQDIQFFTNPGETALDVVNINAVTVANTSGDVRELVWKKPNKNPEQKLEDATIQWLNTKSEWKIYAIHQGGSITTWGEFEQSKYTDDPFAGPWNHWPISLVPSDGRYAVASDRVTHFAVGANDLAPQFGAMIHYGFTTQKVEKIIPLARYWQNPPEITDLNGAKTKGFIKEEKAFYFTDSKDEVSLLINASVDSPVVNPVLIFEGKSLKDPDVRVNGKKAQNVRIGKSRNSQGNINTILFIEFKSEDPLSVTIN